MGNIPYLDNTAWHNGTWCRVRDLQISILDLGLIHSDATYDVMAFINNKAVKLEQHIDRFLASCSYWRLLIGYNKQELIDVVNEMHARTGWHSSIIWLSVTRGVPESGNPRDLLNCTPNVMCYAKPYQLFNGTNTATVYLSNQLRVPDIALNQNHKNFVWQDLTRAQWQAIDRGYDTAVLMSTDGFLTEGPGFNVAIVKDNVVLAPAANRLPGVSMQLIKDLCDENNISFEFANIDLPTLLSCNDMFLTTTIGNLTTVTKFNDRTFAPSKIQTKLINLLGK